MSRRHHRPNPRHHRRPRHSSFHIRMPLIAILPEGGFKWRSNYKRTPMLPESEARRVTRAMGTAGRRLGEDVVAEYLAMFFIKAKELVALCGETEPHRFWDEVGNSCIWSRHLSGSNLYKLSLCIISARRLFHDRIDFITECQAEGNYLEVSLERNFNDANYAVDGFTNAVIETYGSNSETREKYCPKWTNISDNEWTESSTENFLELAAGMGRLSLFSGRQDTENLEDRDGDVEMGDAKEPDEETEENEDIESDIEITGELNN